MYIHSEVLYCQPFLNDSLFKGRHDLNKHQKVISLENNIFILNFIVLAMMPVDLAIGSCSVRVTSGKHCMCTAIYLKITLL